ncbi:MAG: biotin--[acetyl-CoA-carboxylase] ligase [Myxococcales bacterium]|nr:biotin--[acetyl-CoA-carboxylase] ligase [Myxococcales bacterium]
MIALERLAAALKTHALGRDVRVVDETPSTMDLAHEAVAQGAPDGWTVVTRRQTAGRGARGRSWSSEEGASLPFSFVVRPLRAGSLLALAVGLGLAESLERRGVEARVKWPNDVLVRDRKIAGILVEARSMGGRAPDAAVVGVGVNVRPQPYPDDVLATDLATELPGFAASELEVFFAETLEAIETWIDRAVRTPSAVARGLDARLAWRGEAVVVDDGLRGRVLGVDEEGELLIETDEGTQQVRAGRVRRAT